MNVTERRFKPAQVPQGHCPECGAKTGACVVLPVLRKRSKKRAHGSRYRPYYCGKNECLEAAIVRHWTAEGYHVVLSVEHEPLEEEGFLRTVSLGNRGGTTVHLHCGR